MSKAPATSTGQAPLRGPIRFSRAITRSSLSASEKLVCHALLDFANWKGGGANRIWASAESIALRASRSIRQTYATLGILEAKGVVIKTGKTRGGRSRDGTWLTPKRALSIEMLESLAAAMPEEPNPAAAAPLSGNGCSSTLQETAVNPAAVADNQNPHQKPTTEQVASGGAVARLSEELKNHENLTPDRRAWIEKVAPTKKNPPGWATKNIREAWPVPDEFKTDPAVALREAKWSAFRALPLGERDAIRAEANRRNPYFEGKPLDTPGLRGAIAEVMSGAIPANHVKESQ